MSLNKESIYRDVCLQTEGLLAGETDLIANLANLSAILWMNLTDINWCGFYLVKGEELVLGPFQGKPACIRIPLGKGVCGTAAKTGEVQLVDNVHEFSGHIACDAASNSEVVLPFYHQQQLVGVLDIDSPMFSRFDDEDVQGLQQVINILQASLA
ncbi:GAF domain-containing protein [Neptunicella sp. SCSIO 80796]|uniref:GAF domain-containing protein n=1 Tax=Neptunicella plasticusilytica TaxID=3117012 RepID=UPI003A4DFB19